MRLPWIVLAAGIYMAAAPSAMAHGGDSGAAPLPGSPDVETASVMPTARDMSMLNEVNRHRAQHGLPDLRYEPRLFACAREHSERQVRGHFLGHGDHAGGPDTFSARLRRQGYTGHAIAEVVAGDYVRVGDVLQKWLDSPSHRDMLLDPDMSEAAFACVNGDQPGMNRWTGILAEPLNRSRTLPLEPTDPREAAGPGAQPGRSVAEAGARVGSGFFVSPDGYFVTCHHVVAAGRRVVVRTPKGTFDAELIEANPEADLAVLKMAGTFEFLPVRGSAGMRLADRVATLGYPNVDLQGLSPKYSSGDVASLSGPDDDKRYVQVSLPIQPGNSGGPLVDASGCVVGVIAGQLDKGAALQQSGNLPENVNYAVRGTLLLGLLETVPGLMDKIRQAHEPALTTPQDVARALEAACGMVVVRR